MHVQIFISTTANIKIKMKDCNNCELKKFPACENDIPCCRCDKQNCNSRQPCPNGKEYRHSKRENIKVDMPLTSEEKLILAEKTGYSPASIDRIIRGYSPVLPRHKKLVELYNKIIYLKKMHEENYRKDLEEI